MTLELLGVSCERYQIRQNSFLTKGRIVRVFGVIFFETKFLAKERIVVTGFDARYHNISSVQT